MGRWPARDLAFFVSRRVLIFWGQKPGFWPQRSAAVLVAGPQPTTAYADDAKFEVDVVPLHAEDLALAQPEGERDDPAGGVAVLARFGEEALDLLDRVRLDLLLFNLGGLGDGGGVRGEVLAAHGLVQRRTDRAVSLVGGAGGAALSEIVAGRQQTAELVRLREQVGQIAAIAGQALQGRNSSLA